MELQDRDLQLGQRFHSICICYLIIYKYRFGDQNQYAGKKQNH